MAKKAVRQFPVSILSAWWSTWLLIAFLTGGALVASWVYLTSPGQLPFKSVSIQGEFEYLDRADVERRVEEYLEGGFVSLDMDTLRAAINELPWVADVAIRRQWPDTLHIQVTEQSPLAHWGEKAFVNLQGDVFIPEKTLDVASSIYLMGPEGSSYAVVEQYLALRSSAVSLPIRLKSLSLNQYGEWHVKFDDGLDLELGSEAVAERWQRFVKHYSQVVALKKPQRIDMRYEHGFAVRWSDEAVIEVKANG